MIKKTIMLISVTALLSAQNADEFAKQQMQGFQKEKMKFDSYKKDTLKEFYSYQKAQEKAMQEYKKEIGAYWDDPKLSSQKNWVSYASDNKTRTNVDFEQEKIIIQTIAVNQEEAKQKLRQALARIVTIDTKKAQESDPLERKLQQIKKPDDVVDASIKAEPILSTIIFEKTPSQQKVKEYVDKNVDDSDITSKESTKLKNNTIYTLTVKMPDNATLERSKIYYDDIKENAAKQQLPISLVFAIMHTESCFNPNARSLTPAYGLMQIVPSTAGIDTYQFLYNERKLVTSEYLYNSTNNITMGSAYLHMLYYNYLKDIKNPQSRLYCAIASYNTGSGNVAWAFVRNNDIKKAAQIINEMSPEDVYDKLLSDLKYDEPKNYLRDNISRMGVYQQIYGI